MNAEAYIPLLDALASLGTLITVTLLALFASRELVRGLRFAMLPKHEKLIARYRVPQELADRFRQRVFLDQSYHFQSLERWNASRTRTMRISRELLALSKSIDRSLSGLATKKPTLALAIDELCTQLIKDLASATWVPEDWDEKLRAIERFQRTLEGSGDSQVQQERRVA